MIPKWMFYDFYSYFCGISAFVNNLNLSKSYECSEPPAEKTGEEDFILQRDR